MALSLQPALDRLNIVRGRTYRSDPERAEMIAEAVEICVLEILEFLTLPTTTPLPTSVPPMSEATVEEVIAHLSDEGPMNWTIGTREEFLVRSFELLKFAAAELKRLRAENENLRKLLKPFGDYADREFADGGPLLGEYLKISRVRITWGGEHDIPPGAFRRAALGERNGGAG